MFTVRVTLETRTRLRCYTSFEGAMVDDGPDASDVVTLDVRRGERVLMCLLSGHLEVDRIYAIFLPATGRLLFIRWLVNDVTCRWPYPWRY